MPPDVNENYDPPERTVRGQHETHAERHHGVNGPHGTHACGYPVMSHELGPDGKLRCPGGVQADVLRLGGAVRAALAPPEPPIYTVVSFRVRHGGRVYDYAAVRAGDGKWYATGGETKQGVDWGTLVGAVRPKLVGPLQVMQPTRSLFL